MRFYHPRVKPHHAAPWNKGKIIGQKAPLKLKEIWAIRFRLQHSGRLRDLALFNLAIYSKLRGCDLVRLKLTDVTQSGRPMSRATVIQQKTKQKVQFEITEQTRDSIDAWVLATRPADGDYLFPSTQLRSRHLSTRQYRRCIDEWVSEIGLDPSRYGTHSMRRTKVTLIYQRTKNLRAVQLLLGHTKLESTVRYLGVEVEDALEISEQTDV
jgi:integrase